MKGDELKLGIVILVCIDALFESVSAALVIASNVYCGGLSSFSSLAGFNYCKMIFYDFFVIFLNFYYQYTKKKFITFSLYFKFIYQ